MFARAFIWAMSPIGGIAHFFWVPVRFRHILFTTSLGPVRLGRFVQISPF